MKILIAPSILSADFGKLEEEIKTVEPYAEMIHVDVMDGHFVPNITFGPHAVASLRCGRPMDVHLMIEHPEKYLEAFAKAITDAHGERKDCYITVHQEACTHLHRTAKKIKELGCKVGVALKPKTPLGTIEANLDDFDIVLLMTVEPGFGGQEFMEEVLPKINDLRKRAPKLNIQVDGGINAETAKLALKAGANVIVAGSYIFKSKDRKAAIESLRMSIHLD